MKKSLNKIITVIILASIIFGYVSYKAINTPTLKDTSITITINIKSGSTVTGIAEKLERANLISNAKWFKLYTRITGKDKDIKGGIFKLHGEMNLIEIVEYLTHNNQEVYYYPNKLTIPEGLALEQMEKRLIEANLGTKEEIRKLFHDKIFIKSNLNIEASSLEGFIYPKTYYYEDGLTLKEFLINYPLAEFKDEYAKYLSDPSFYKNLILASIVEKESGSASEKPIVASVFKNRIKRNMTLSSCATHNKIFYQRGKKPPRVLLNVHLEIDSPYNTYKHNGLPPTPICSPAKDSFEAVVSDVNTDYLYFFADFKGNNIFSVTYQEHNRKKKTSWQNNSLR
jgi:UPF0755 protein